MFASRFCIQLMMAVALGACTLELPEADPGVPDAGEPDAGSCAVQPDPLALALYRFEEPSGQTIEDATGKHPGMLVGVEGTDWQRTNGAPQCGRAVRFTPTGATVPLAKIAHHSDWDLEQGSVELHVRFDAPAPTAVAEGVLSRDSNLTPTPGHLLVFRACDSRLVVRLQRSDSEQFYVCSPPVTDSNWHRLGINFGGGPLELYVDGKRATSTTPVDCKTPPGVLPCGTGQDTTAGIDGNTNPWVLGAVTWSNAEGDWDVLAGKPLAGAVDSFQIRGERWDFAE